MWECALPVVEPLLGFDMVGQQPVGDPVSGADEANAVKDALGNCSRLELIESVLRPWYVVYHFPFSSNGIVDFRLS